MHTPGNTPCRENTAHYRRAECKIVIKPLTERDIQVLQYLSGYVIHSLVRKIHRFTNWRSTNSQDLLTLFYAAKSDFSSQKLIRCQTKGGLWAVTAKCLQVIKIVEEFHKETSAIHVTRIDSSKISEVLLQIIDISAAVNNQIVHFYDRSLKICCSTNIAEIIISSMEPSQIQSWSMSWNMTCTVHIHQL